MGSADMQLPRFQSSTVAQIFQRYGHTEYVEGQLRPYFPTLVSYSHFVELRPRALVPLCGYLHTHKGRCTGITFDSTPLAVCHHKRSMRHQVFDGYATRGFMVNLVGGLIAHPYQDKKPSLVLRFADSGLPVAI